MTSVGDGFMPKGSARKSIAFAVAAMALIGTGARGQPTAEYDIIGKPSKSLRETIASSAHAYLTDLPVVKGSKISDELLLPGARKLHAVCVRWTSPGQASGNSAYTFMFVTLTEGLPESAWGDDPRCREPRLQFYPFPEMR